MTVDEALELVEQLVESGHLNKLQKLVFRGAWDEKTYEEIGTTCGYDTEYIKDVGFRLWRSLSQALNQKVSKYNFRSVLKQYVREQEHAPLPQQPLPQQPLIQRSTPQNNLTHPSASASPLTLPLTSPPRLFDDFEADAGIDHTGTHHVTIKHNLPICHVETLIGREYTLTQLLEWLNHDRTPYMSIEGLGGMGKTTLALAVAHYCLRSSLQVNNPSLNNSHFKNVLASKFEAIIFTSAKQHYLTAQGIVQRLRSERSLRDIFRAIAHGFACPDLLVLNFNEQLERIYMLLSRQPTLLIIDNLETLDDQQQILSFLYDLPATVKVLITSREKTNFPSIRLTKLTQSEAICLIQHHAQIKRLELSEDELVHFYQQTGGVPAAIVYALGQLAAGYPLSHASSQLTVPTGEFTQFYFQDSIAPLRGKMAYQLLLALALFSKSASAEAIAYVAGCDNSEALIDGLAQIQQRSLVNHHQGRYDMLPLTRSLAVAELKTIPDFEHHARDRWVEWYLCFAKEHKGKDWKQWDHYQYLEQEWDNLQDAIEWCIANDRYIDARQFWRYVNCYSQAQGYRSNRLTCWNTRLDWLEWLIQAAEQHQDWLTVADVLFDHAWILTLLRNPHYLEKAECQFARAWQLRHHQTDIFQINLAIHIAAFKIQQNQFDAAMEWLDRATELLANGSLDPLAAQQQSTVLNYYRGEIYCKTGHAQQAKTVFQTVLSQAQTLDLQRIFTSTHDCLVDIALGEGQFTTAQDLLANELRMAEAQHDYGRVAFCKRSLAQLEKVRGNGAIARQWAAEAKHLFERLGMVSEVQDTEAFQQSLDAFSEEFSDAFSIVLS